MDADSARSLFPVTREWAYLDNASVPGLPVTVQGAVERVLDEHARAGAVNRSAWLARMAATRQRLADFLGCGPEEVAFPRNTVEGLSWVARGIRWREGDNVIVPDLEFAGNVYPWWNLKTLGVEMRMIASRDGRVLIEDIVAAMDRRTRLVSISFVQFVNGFRIDLNRLGEACRERRVLLCVDAIQGLGAVPLNVHAVPIDFLAAGAHKWMLGPLGAGCFYCRTELLEELDVAEAGHHSGPVPEGDWLVRDLALFPDARRFEGGVYAFPQIAGYHAALDLLMEVGVENIWRKIRRLTDQLVEGLRRLGYDVVSPLGEGERSGIISFRPGGHDPARLQRDLETAGVVVANRSGLIRVSPHFYNNEADIDRLMAALPTPSRSATTPTAARV